VTKKKEVKEVKDKRPPSPEYNAEDDQAPSYGSSYDEETPSEDDENIII